MKEVAVYTSRGTLIQSETMRLVNLDLDAFLMIERVGFNMDTSTVRIPWKKIMIAANVDSTNPNKKALLSFVDSHLDKWLEEKRNSGPATVEMDPKFAKAATKLIPQLLSKSGNKNRLEVLATLFAIGTDGDTSEENVSHIIQQIRLFCAQNNGYVISRGAGAIVYRTLNDKGNPTGVVVPAPGSSPGSKKTVERYTAKVQALGLSKQQFIEAKANGAETMDDLKKVAAKL